MKRLMIAVLLLAAQLCATSCQSPSPAPPTPSGSPPTVGSPGSGTPSSAAAGDDNGARAVVNGFLAPNADKVALTRALRPNDDDYAAVFDATFADTAKAYYTQMWASARGGVGPKKKQTEVLFGKATTADLKSGNPEGFPDGWKKVAPHLKDGLTIYRFSFVEPGKKRGMSYEGLIYVNGHWALFPKPWRAMK